MVSAWKTAGFAIFPPLCPLLGYCQRTDILDLPAAPVGQCFLKKTGQELASGRYLVLWRGMRSGGV